MERLSSFLLVTQELIGGAEIQRQAYEILEPEL